WPPIAAVTDMAAFPVVMMALAVPALVAFRLAPAKSRQGPGLGESGADLVAFVIPPRQCYPSRARGPGLELAQLAGAGTVAPRFGDKLGGQRFGQNGLAPGAQAAQLAFVVEHGVDLRAIGQLALDAAAATRAAFAFHIGQPGVLQDLGQRDRRLRLG